MAEGLHEDPASLQAPELRFHVEVKEGVFFVVVQHMLQKEFRIFPIGSVTLQQIGKDFFLFPTSGNGCQISTSPFLT